MSNATKTQAETETTIRECWEKRRGFYLMRRGDGSARLLAKTRSVATAANLVRTAGFLGCWLEDHRLADYTFHP